jgi:hypothetical protein
MKKNKKTKSKVTKNQVMALKKKYASQKYCSVCHKRYKKSQLKYESIDEGIWYEINIKCPKGHYIR